MKNKILCFLAFVCVGQAFAQDRLSLKDGDQAIIAASHRTTEVTCDAGLIVQCDCSFASRLVKKVYNSQGHFISEARLGQFNTERECYEAGSQDLRCR